MRQAARLLWVPGRQLSSIRRMNAHVGGSAVEELRTLEPPRGLVDKAAGKSQLPWHRIGERWLESMREWGQLRPDARVLDVGCGMGRMAVPLAFYLSEQGSYRGFDVQASAIEWCKREIEPRWPQSEFQVAQVRSSGYRRRGLDAASYRFPYDDDSFDFAFLTSVFTHMVRPEVENYLSEIRRVLRSGGRTFATYYLLNRSAREAIRRGEARYAFSRETSPGCYEERHRWNLAAAAYDEDLLLDLYREHGFDTPIVHHGTWSGAYPDARHGQDTVVAAVA